MKDSTPSSAQIMADPTVEFSYRPPRQLTENLWEVSGDWKNKFGRRMTVIRTNDGRVAIHNAIRLHETDLKWLRSLGSVSFIIAPNTFHCSDAGWMALNFPQATLFVPSPKLKSFRAQGFDPKDVNKDFPVSMSTELKCIPMEGMRISEAAFFHVPSRTLILCDTAFNMADVFSGMERIIMRWNKVGGRFGPSRLMKLAFTKDKLKLLASYNELFQLDFDRVVVNHGDVLEEGGREKLRASVAEIF